jgi:hypothetical protein
MMKEITYKSKEIKERIFSSIMNEYLKSGFYLKKSRDEFVLTKDGYSNIIHFRFTAWSLFHSLDIALYISVHSVEKMLKSITGESTNITMGNDISYIYNSPNGREIIHRVMAIDIRQNEDVDAAAETAIIYLNKIAIPYFNLYNNLYEINNIFNRPPFDYIPANLGGSLDDRCMRGLIIAKMVNSPDLEFLVNTYNNLIKRTPPGSISQYVHVRDYLLG